MNVNMHGKSINYIDLNPVWTQSGNPERIEAGNGITLSLSATYHGDHDEFWVVELKGDREVRRFSTRGIQHIRWSAQGEGRD